jgi:hypothetical protein
MKKPQGPWEVLVGINFPHPTRDGEMRAEPGDVVDGIPDIDVPWLLEQNVIRKAEGGEKS